MITFRQLVDVYRSRGRKFVAPRPMHEVAERFGISRTILYHLFDGRKKAADWTIRRIARAMSHSQDVVRKALFASRKAR